MERLTVDTVLPFCDIAQCASTPGGLFCEDGYCDQRRCYERLRDYERNGPVEEFRALKDAEKKRREGCEFCHDQQNLMYYKFNEYVSCPHCGRDLRGETNHDKPEIDRRY